MTIAKRLKAYLDTEGVAYETVDHPRTSETAQAGHIPGSRLTKTVVIHLESGPVLAVVPSSHRADIGELQSLLDRRLGFASETEIGELFDDCDIGAGPPGGPAHPLPTLPDPNPPGPLKGA